MITPTKMSKVAKVSADVLITIKLPFPKIDSIVPKRDSRMVFSAMLTIIYRHPEPIQLLSTPAIIKPNFSFLLKDINPKSKKTRLYYD